MNYTMITSIELLTFIPALMNLAHCYGHRRVWKIFFLFFSFECGLTKCVLPWWYMSESKYCMCVGSVFCKVSEKELVWYFASDLSWWNFGRMNLELNTPVPLSFFLFWSYALLALYDLETGWRCWLPKAGISLIWMLILGNLFTHSCPHFI